MQLSELGLNRQLYKQSQSVETQDSSYESANNSDGAGASLASGSAANDINTGSVPVNTSQLNGTIPSILLDIADRGWYQSCAFSVTDADTVAWGAGTFTSAGGTTYNISAGNTGNMAAKTFIYLDINVSLTTYQTTTDGTLAVGVGKVMVAVAQNGTTEATFTALQGGGQSINAADIVAGSITANEIAASTITAGKMNVSQLSGITADLGAITAGSIVLNTSGFIRGGQTAYDTGTGFFLGYSSGYKFSLGDSTNKLTWNGSVLGITGTITGGLIQTSSSGIRTVLDGSDSKIKFMDGSTVYAHILPYNFGLTINTKNTGGLAQMYLSESGSNIQAGLFASNAILQMSTVSGNALIQSFSDDYDVIATDDISLDAGGNLDLAGNLRINGTTGKDATIEDVTGDNFLFDEGILILVF